MEIKASVCCSLVNNTGKTDIIHVSATLFLWPHRGVALLQAGVGAVCQKRLPAASTNNTPRHAVKGMEGWSHRGRSKSSLIGSEAGRTTVAEDRDVQRRLPSCLFGGAEYVWCVFVCVWVYKRVCVCVCDRARVWCPPLISVSMLRLPRESGSQYELVVVGVWLRFVCVFVCVCRYSHFHLPCENTPLLIHFPILSQPPPILRTRPPLDIKDTFVLNLVPCFSTPLFWRPTVNIRCKSAYFQIPSIRAGRTKRGLYGPFRAPEKGCKQRLSVCSLTLGGHWQWQQCEAERWLISLMLCCVGWMSQTELNKQRLRGSGMIYLMGFRMDEYELSGCGGFTCPPCNP